jgi:Rap1a immunity proteins
MSAYSLPTSLGAGFIALTALSGIAQAAVTEDTFISKTTGDLAALCSAVSTDRLYTAAVNFCYGFGAGAYGVLAAAQQADPKLRLFCAPPQITRNEAVAAFVSWAGGKPERMSLPAVDGVAAFLTETYPCPKATTVAPSRRAQ